MNSVSKCGASAAASAMLLAGVTATTWGAGYGIVERDAAGLGRAFAGQSVVIDAASLSFNPAAVPTGTTASGSLHYLNNDLAPEDAGVSALIPALYGSYKGFGAAVYAPFGLSTDYPDGWEGRYSALRSKIESARVHVTGAYPISDTVRLGAGVFLQRMSAKLTSAYPLGFADAEISVDGADNGFGFSLGALWQPRKTLTLGDVVLVSRPPQVAGQGGPTNKHREYPREHDHARVDHCRFVLGGKAESSRPGWDHMDPLEPPRRPRHQA